MKIVKINYVKINYVKRDIIMNVLKFFSWLFLSLLSIDFVLGQEQSASGLNMESTHLTLEQEFNGFLSDLPTIARDQWHPPSQETSASSTTEESTDQLIRNNMINSVVNKIWNSTSSDLQYNRLIIDALNSYIYPSTLDPDPSVHFPIKKILIDFFMVLGNKYKEETLPEKKQWGYEQVKDHIISAVVFTLLESVAGQLNPLILINHTFIVEMHNLATNACVLSQEVQNNKVYRNHSIKYLQKSYEKLSNMYELINENLPRFQATQEFISNRLIQNRQEKLTYLYPNQEDIQEIKLQLYLHTQERLRKIRDFLGQYLGLQRVQDEVPHICRGIHRNMETTTRYLSEIENYLLSFQKDSILQQPYPNPNPNPNPNKNHLSRSRNILLELADMQKFFIDALPFYFL